MKKLSQLGLILMVCFAFSGCVVQVEDGQVGVKNDFGHIGDEVLNAGWHFFVPAVTQIELWNVKLQELKETAEVPSSEGLISQLDISIMYQVPADKASFVRKKIGPYYVSVVLEPYVREAIRNVASGYAVKALYSEAGRKEIGKNILDFLKGKLDEKGIIIQDVLLRDVKLPPSFSQSIELKLKAEQEALQKEFELQKAKKDAEIEVAKAGGVAQANQIIGDSLKSNDSYLKYLWIRSLKDTKNQVIYVPTETGLPILEASRNQTK
ncbi:MAG: prohibitin family protein [Candidatus Omnitrophota bacterium]